MQYRLMHIFTTALWDTDKYKDRSEVTEQRGRRKKNLFHVTILIRTMKTSKAEAENPTYTAAYPISSN